MMNDLPIDVLPDAETFYLTDVFPLYLLSINTMRVKGWGRQSCCLSPAWEMLPRAFFFAPSTVGRAAPHGWMTAVYYSSWYAMWSSS